MIDENDESLIKIKNYKKFEFAQILIENNRK
jgi:hypothetical protein